MPSKSAPCKGSNKKHLFRKSNPMPKTKTKAAPSGRLIVVVLLIGRCHMDG